MNKTAAHNKRRIIKSNIKPIVLELWFRIHYMKLYRERTTKDFLWALVLHSGKL